jgi:hypothetical protein
VTNQIDFLYKKWRLRTKLKNEIPMTQTQETGKQEPEETANTERASTPFSHTVGPGIRRLDCLLAAGLILPYPKVGRLRCSKFLLI